MKRISLKLVLIMTFLMLSSCNETVVTNIVHPDGSVTRRIEIKDQDKKSFQKENFRVPFDESWTISDTFEVSFHGDTVRGDTTWIRKAEKLFKNVSEINKEYENDKGSNKDFVREARFSKKFRWFNTLYTFSENIEKSFIYGYPVGQYLSGRELEYFYMPENILNERKKGPDSTMVKQIEDTLNSKKDHWFLMCCISEWREEFLRLAQKKGLKDITSESLMNKDPEIVNMLEKSIETYANADPKDSVEFQYDSVFRNIVKTALGDDFPGKYETEIDTTLNILMNRFNKHDQFQSYSVKTIMPGSMVATNGFIDQKGEILWSVKSDFFLTQNYQMWAESKTSNTWAWIVSGVFLLFVLAGFLFRLYKK